MIKNNTFHKIRIIYTNTARCGWRWIVMEECGKIKNNKCKCLSIVFGVLIALFLGVIGTIIGTVFAETILSALAAVIVLAIVLGVLAIIVGFLILCSCKRKNCCY